GVRDADIEWFVELFDFGRAGANRFAAFEFARERNCLSLYRATRIGSLGQRARSRNDGCAPCREPTQRFRADSGIDRGAERYLAVEVDPRRHLFSGTVSAEFGRAHAATGSTLTPTSTVCAP